MIYLVNFILFLMKFLFGMTCLVVSELICIFLIYFYRQKILDHSSFLFQTLITQYTEDDDVRGLVDKIQSDLKCCGISSSNDWDFNQSYNCSSSGKFACSVPQSCCFNFNLVKITNSNSYVDLNFKVLFYTK